MNLSSSGRPSKIHVTVHLHTKDTNEKLQQWKTQRTHRKSQTQMTLKYFGIIFFCFQLIQKCRSLEYNVPVTSGAESTKKDIILAVLSSLVWGDFALSGPGQLAVIMGNMDSALYQKILKENVLSSVCKLKLKFKKVYSFAIWDGGILQSSANSHLSLFCHRKSAPSIIIVPNKIGGLL